MNLIKGYWKSNGKIPEGKEENRVILSKPPQKGDYVAVLNDKLCRIDIDDYLHGTGKIDEPIKGEPRSKAIIDYLDNRQIKYIGIRTEHGVHFIFRLPEWYKIEKNKNDWYCSVGIKIEVHVTKVCEPMIVNGVERRFFKGDFDSEVDELPAILIPIQKSKEKPFLLSFESGDRNNHLSEYAFHLVNQGFQADDVKEVIEAINKYIMEEPLTDSEINTILRPDTMEKLTEISEQKNNVAVSPENFKKFLDSLGMRIKYNELLNIVEYENIPNTAEYQDITDIQNVMPIKLTCDFRKFTKKQNITKHQVIDLILLEADTHTHNPVKDFLKSTKWDGKDRFPEIFKILGVTNEIRQSFIRKWFYQTASLPFNKTGNPLQPEGVLILKGEEGIGKTRFFQQMAFNPLWFTSLDRELNTNNKDTLIQVLSVWIAEIGEIDRTFKSNKSDVKSFMTGIHDTVRKPYRPEPVTKARTTSFCGTTNKDVLLNDDSGSRRWWIIPIENHFIDLGNFTNENNMKQFWAQCYHEFSVNSKCFILSDEEKAYLKEENKDSMELLPSEEELLNRLDFDAPESEWHEVTVSTIKNLPEYNVDRYTIEQIGKALSAISQNDTRVLYKRTKKGRKWFIPPTISNVDRYGNEQ